MSLQDDWHSGQKLSGRRELDSVIDLLPVSVGSGFALVRGLPWSALDNVQQIECNLNKKRKTLSVNRCFQF